MMLPKRNWMEMTWQEIAGAETGRWIAVLPLAAVEQHGPHLPLGVDTYIAEAYLARVHQMLPADLPVAFLPVQRVGVSTEHLSYPGTLTFSATTAITAWTELGESLARAGVRKLVLVSSHGGNVAPHGIGRARSARAARHARGDSRLAPVRLPGRCIFGRGEKTRHPWRRYRDFADARRAPETVHIDKAPNAPPATIAMAREFKWLGAYRPAGFAWMTQDLNPTGAVGDATRANAQKGEAVLAHGARAFVELLREIDRFDLARLSEGPLAK
jgi:creatinine amidohydrolase